MRVKLGEVCDINPKIQVTDDHVEVSFVPMQNVSEDGIIYLSETRLYGEVKKGFTSFHNGDVLFAKITPCMENGKGGIVKNLKNGLGFGSTEFHVLRPHSDIVLSDWLYYLTSWPVFRKECEKNMTGSAGQKRVPKSFLEEYKLFLPPLETQRHIAAVLDKVSALIALRRQQLDKLDELVKARFVEMFGAYTETARLSDVATISGGLTKSTKRDKLPLRMPYLRVANVSFAAINVSEMLDIGLTDEEYSKTLLQRGDLLFVEGNGNPDQIGRVAIWENQVVPCVHQNHLIKARFNKGLVISSFAMYYFMSPKGREQIKKKAVSTSGLYTLSVSKISDLMLPIPPLDLQNQFAAFATQTEKTKAAVQQALEKLETMKKALMQEYFGGEV